MQYMFSGCSSLKTLDMRNATIPASFSSLPSNSTSMFSGTSDLTVFVKDETARSFIQWRLGNNSTAVIA